MGCVVDLPSISLHCEPANRTPFFFTTAFLSFHEVERSNVPHDANWVGFAKILKIDDFEVFFAQINAALASRVRETALADPILASLLLYVSYTKSWHRNLGVQGSTLPAYLTTVPMLRQSSYRKILSTTHTVALNVLI